MSEWKIYPSQTFGRPKFPALMMFVSCLFVCLCAYFIAAVVFFLVSAQETEKMIQEWDGLTRYLDAAMSRFFKVDNYEVR